MTPEWRRVVRLIAALWFGFAFGVGAYYDIELYLGTRDACPTRPPAFRVGVY